VRYSTVMNLRDRWFYDNNRSLSNAQNRFFSKLTEPKRKVITLLLWRHAPVHHKLPVRQPVDFLSYTVNKWVLFYIIEVNYEYVIHPCTFCKNVIRKVHSEREFGVQIFLEIWSSFKKDYLRLLSKQNYV